MKSFNCKTTSCQESNSKVCMQPRYCQSHTASNNLQKEILINVTGQKLEIKTVDSSQNCLFTTLKPVIKSHIFSEFPSVEQSEPLLQPVGRIYFLHPAHNTLILHCSKANLSPTSKCIKNVISNLQKLQLSVVPG